MEKSGQLIKSFALTLVILMAIGFFLRGHDLESMPWQIYGPGAALYAIVNVYVLPRFKKGKEE